MLTVREVAGELHLPTWAGECVSRPVRARLADADLPRDGEARP